MADRYDVLVVREGKDGGKSWFTKVGAMFRSKTGDGFMIQLDALPMDGKLILRVPLERDGDHGGRRDAPAAPAERPSVNRLRGGPGDDNIPFLREDRG